MDILFNLRNETVDHAWPAAPICVEPSATVREVFRKLKEGPASSLMVCRDGILVGIFTERDALRIMARGGDLNAPVETVMSRDPVTLSVQATVGKAIVKMSSGGYRNLPIVDPQGRPVGIVRVAGIVHYLAEHFPQTVYNQPPVAHPVMQDREGS